VTGAAVPPSETDWESAVAGADSDSDSAVTRRAGAAMAAMRALRARFDGMEISLRTSDGVEVEESGFGVSPSPGLACIRTIALRTGRDKRPSREGMLGAAAEAAVSAR
jgi:hypothetical protein